MTTQLDVVSWNVNGFVDREQPELLAQLDWDVCAIQEATTPERLELFAALAGANQLALVARAPRRTADADRSPSERGGGAGAFPGAGHGVERGRGRALAGAGARGNGRARRSCAPGRQHGPAGGELARLGSRAERGAVPPHRRVPAVGRGSPHRGPRREHPAARCDRSRRHGVLERRRGGAARPGCRSRPAGRLSGAGRARSGAGRGAASGAPRGPARSLLRPPQPGSPVRVRGTTPSWPRRSSR